MSLVDDAPHTADIALQELGPDASADRDRPDAPVDQDEPDRTSEPLVAADGDIEMTTTEPVEAIVDDADSGKENVKDQENGHSARDAGGVKKILKSGVFGGQCASDGQC